MRRITIPFLALGLLLAIPACGGGDDDGGDGTQIDASGGGGGTIDAGGGGGGIDAAGGAAAAIGRVCNPVANDCPTAAPDCVQIGNTDRAICTVPCGTSNSETPPASGDATCQDAYDGTATAACTMAQVSSGTYSWFCGLQCGTIGASNYGTCPDPLACNDNGAAPGGGEYIDSCQ